MDAVPPIVSGLEVDPAGRYTCPLCKVQNAGDASDTGWVACPMIDRMICLGSCLDFQSIARSSEFENHPWRSMFEELAQTTGDKVQRLRWSCLRHQIDVIDDQLRGGTSEAAALGKLRQSVVRAMARTS